MTFVLEDNTEGFTYPINIPVVEKNGASKNHRLQMIFKRLDRSEIADLQKEYEGINQSDFSIDALETDIDYIFRIAEGWKDVVDKDRTPLEFNRDNLRMLLKKIPNASGEIAKGFYEATYGGGAKRKN